MDGRHVPTPVRQEIDTVVEHSFEPGAQAPGGRARQAARIRDGSLVREYDLEDRPHSTNRRRHTRLDGGGADALHQLLSAALGRLESGAVIAGKFLQCCFRRGQDRRVAVEASAVQHGGVFNQLQNLTAAGDDAEREPTCNRFPECGQIRRDAVQALRAVQMHTKPRYDLVEDQHDPILCSDVSQRLKESVGRQDAAAVAQNGLQDHAGDLIRVLCDSFFERICIVPRQEQGSRRRFEPTVIVVHESQNPLPAGKGSGQAKGDLVCFRPRIAENDTVGAGNKVDKPLGDTDFTLMLCSVVPAVLQGSLDRGGDRGMRMTENQRPPGKRVIEIGVAVDVGDARPLTMREIEWMGDGLCPKGAGHAAGNGFLGALQQLHGLPPGRGGDNGFGIWHAANLGIE